MYEVGEVLYVISNKRRNVVPVQVVEQIVRRTAEGENVTFKVALPTQTQKSVKKENNIVDLHTVQGTVHKTLDEVRIVLYEQASSAINDLLNTAYRVASNKFGAAAAISQVPPQKQDADEEEDPVSPYYETPKENVSEKYEPLDFDVLTSLETQTLEENSSEQSQSILDFTGASGPSDVRVQLPDGSFANIKSQV